MELAKIENGFIYPKKLEIIDGKQTSNPTDEMLISIGFMEVVREKLEEGKMYGNPYEKDGKIYFDIVDSPMIQIGFNVMKFKDDVKSLMGLRMLDLYDMWGVILDNLKTPMLDEHYKTIKFFMDGLLAKGKIIQSDYDIFVQCFSNQEIDILTYE